MTNSVHVSSESKQDYVTPMDFIHTVERRFGVEFLRDLAASHENARCDHYFTLEDNSLSKAWAYEMLGDDILSDYCAWLNPPFKGVTPWMKKCAEESAKGLKIITLTLSSLGSQWYKNHVKPNAMTFILEDRIVFEGQKDPYPKELMVSLFGFGMTGLGFWNWKEKACRK